jgi:hypothetical protein
MPTHVFPRRLFLTASFAFASWLIVSAEGQSDVFVLKSGGEIHGTQVNADGAAETLRIRTAEGTLALDASQVAEVIREPAQQAEYERLRREAGDNVIEQFRLAKWCRDHEMEPERRLHLERVIALDPDFAEARQALGYAMVRGRWTLSEDRRRAQGYERYRGRWRLAQEIELREEHARRRQAEVEWVGKLQRWRDAASREGRGPLFENIAAIRDPLALRALRQSLAAEPWRPLRLAYVAALGRIADAGAIEALTWAAIEHADEEVRFEAIEQLAPLKNPRVVKHLAQTLKDPQVRRVRNAAVALGRLGDESALEPLIDALITSRTHVVSRGSSAMKTASFTQTGSIISAGKQATTMVERSVNQEALEALSRLSGGASFGFDQEAWRRWLASTRKYSPQTLSSLR